MEKEMMSKVYSGKKADRMKASQYNIEVSNTNGDVVLYNTRTNILIRVPDKAYEQLKKIEDLQEPESQSYISSFKKRGFCVPAEWDESAQLYEQSMHFLKTSSEELFFTIAVTTACNYRCPYCFEEGVPVREMSDETVDKLCTMIEKTAAHTKGCKRISIKWFGGEPLLAFSVIRKVSARIKEYCEQHAISMHTRIITNGALLTEEILDTLANYGLISVHISMDGTCEEYCRYKVATPENYRTVMDVIKTYCEKVHFVLRFNCVPGNLQSLMDLASELYANEKVRQHISLYLAHIQTDRMETFDASGFADAQLAFIRHLRNLGWYSQVRDMLPTRLMAPCVNIKKEFYIVDAAGSIFACESDVGNDAMRMASLEDDVEDIWAKKEAQCRNYNRPLIGKCKSCAYYPLCFSGCFHYPRKEEDCCVFQKQILDTLNLIAHTVG